MIDLFQLNYDTSFMVFRVMYTLGKRSKLDVQRGLLLSCVLVIDISNTFKCIITLGVIISVAHWSVEIINLCF